jgi:hypothetical protein
MIPPKLGVHKTGSSSLVGGTVLFLWAITVAKINRKVMKPISPAQPATWNGMQFA